MLFDNTTNDLRLLCGSEQTPLRCSELVDRRVRKTREALHAALMSLVVERGYDALTVEDILVSADVGRSTFYAHFPGKDALLGFGFERLRQDLDHAIASAGPRSFGFLPGLAAHARSHVGLYRALLGSRGSAIAHSLFRDIVTEYVSAELGRGGGASIAIRASFCAGGIVSALETWLSASKPLGVDQFVHLVDELLQGADPARFHR
jgi:AcrR family transcriptional regulator